MEGDLLSNHEQMLGLDGHHELLPGGLGTQMWPDLHHQQTQHNGGVLLSILPHDPDLNHTIEPREIPCVVDPLSRNKDQCTEPLHERSPRYAHTNKDAYVCCHHSHVQES